MTLAPDYVDSARSMPVGDIIVSHDAFQIREAMSEDQIINYAEIIESGARMPPLDVVRFQDGTVRLADGFHRFIAYQRCGATTIPVMVREGDELTVLEIAIENNRNHGVTLTSQDRRKAAMMIMRLHRRRGLPIDQGEIAAKCGVHRTSVARWFREMDEIESEGMIEPEDTDTDSAAGNELPDFVPSEPDQPPPPDPTRPGRKEILIRQIEEAEALTARMVTGLEVIMEQLDILVANPRGAWFRAKQQSLRDELDKLRRTFDSKTPEALCPVCEATEGVECKYCQNRGWMSREEYAVHLADQRAREKINA